MQKALEGGWLSCVLVSPEGISLGVFMWHQVGWLGHLHSVLMDSYAQIVCFSEATSNNQLWYFHWSLLISLFCSVESMWNASFICNKLFFLASSTTEILSHNGRCWYVPFSLVPSPHVVQDSDTEDSYGHFISRNPNGASGVEGSYTAPSGEVPRNGWDVLM